MEVGYANGRGWDCENENDAEGRRNEKSDRWKVSCLEGETNENEGESDIVDAKENVR